jgi:phosphonate transport system substrate-binding protein
MSLISSEDERDAMVRYEPSSPYMQQTLGVPLRAFRATDDTGAVEALRSNRVELSRLGPCSYALAPRVMSERVTAVARDGDDSGAAGYFSVMSRGNMPPIVEKGGSRPAPYATSGRRR